VQIPAPGIRLNGDIQLLYLDVSLTLGESALSACMEYPTELLP